MAAAISLPPQQPDIVYTPDFNKFKARTKKRLATENLEARSLPAGFPSKLESDFVWDGQNVKENYQWVYEFNEREVEEIKDALKHFKCQRLSEKGD